MSILHKLLFSIWYLQKPPWDTRQTPPEVQEFIKSHSPGRALDLGCGTGTNAITLAQNGWQVVAVDFVGRAIRTAIQKAQKARVAIDFQVNDVTKLSNISGYFDLILDIGCYHNLTPKGMIAYRSNINRLLGKHGTYLLYVFYKSEHSNSKSGVLEADIDAFSPPLALISRIDGLERDTRPSAWMQFQKVNGAE